MIHFLHWLLDALRTAAIGGLVGAVVAAFLALWDRLSAEGAIIVASVAAYLMLRAVKLWRGSRLDAWARRPWGTPPPQKPATALSAPIGYTGRHQGGRHRV